MAKSAPIRWRRVRLLLPALAITLCACVRLGPPPPGVSYQADVRVEVVDPDGERRPVEQLTEFYARGLRRRQATIEGHDLVVIDRPDLAVTWILDPAAEAFEELWLRNTDVDAFLTPDPFGPRMEGRFREAGVDEIAGTPARRFEVEGDRVRGVAWISMDGVPIRFEGEVERRDGASTVRIDYGEVQRGPQAAYLFAIPPNYAGYEDRKRRTKERRDDGIEHAIRRLRDEREWRPTNIK
ncbi:MAG: hypothetical protein NXI30_00880 [bacterium]|nr:hypothetical protein [bacterium]